MLVQKQTSAPLYAAIDIGTVTCRLLVARCDGQTLQALAQRAVITNLGEDVDATGVLKPQAMQRVFHTVQEFLDVIHSVSQEAMICAIATSAARDAQNANEFVAGLAERGITLSVISGEQEAALSFAGASRDFTNQPIVVTDIGGGSTEIIAGIAGQKPLFVHSFNIGCRRMTERFLHADPLNASEVEEARLWVRQQFAPYFQTMNQQGFRATQVVSVAGTATSIVSMIQRMKVYDSAAVHGSIVEKDQLDCLFEELAGMNLEQRMHRVGLQPQRASVINAGLIIQQEVLRTAQAHAFIASESDILQGIVFSAAQQTEQA